MIIITIFQRYNIENFLSPLYFYFIENSADVSSLDYLICLFTLSMVLLEQISDEQMHIFKANIENKGKTMNEGLWKYSRHPNYLGEVGFWFGLCGFGLIGSNGSILLLIPLFKLQKVCAIFKDVVGHLRQVHRRGARPPVLAYIFSHIFKFHTLIMVRRSFDKSKIAQEHEKIRTK